MSKLLLFALALTLTAGAVVGPAPRALENRLLTRHVASEVQRLRLHFDTVDQELRQRDVATLSTPQRAARAELIQWLKQYRQTGIFPLNNQVAPTRVPIFRDAQGVLCAMAYLIDRSGRGDLVDRIAREQNTTYIGQLAGDPSLIGWLDSVGLSVTEAARIQPSYEPYPPLVSQDDAVTAPYAITSLLVSGTAMVTGTLNLARPNKTTGILGVLAGTGAIAAGLVHIQGEGSAMSQVAAFNLVAGAAAASLGIRALLRDSKRPPVTAAESGKQRRDPQISLGPAIFPGRRATAVGFTLRATF